MATNTLNHRHAQNIAAKAHRGMQAIAAVADLIVSGGAAPTTLAALRILRRELVGENNPDTWSQIGMAHDLIYRVSGAGRPGYEPTDFRESRETLFMLLASEIDRLENPYTGDPFEGLHE